MRKKVLIIGIFLAVFGAAWDALYLMRGIEEPALEPAAAITEERQVSDSVHSYAAEDLAAGCRAEDKIFCAIEQVIKCTMAPELEGCDKEYVPGFVLGKAEETPRPRHISFEITKIKPIPGSSDISVYTKSDCDAVWFGLCKGTVIYSLTQKDGRWAVTNIYALEM